MKTLATLFSVLIIFAVNGQKPEELIPQEAISVFSLNNINLLQKISLDELVQYEFMEEVQQEIFDGSTAQKTIKDAGIDFNQKLNVFYGRGNDHEPVRRALCHLTDAADQGLITADALHKDDKSSAKISPPKPLNLTSLPSSVRPKPFERSAAGNHVCYLP